MRLNLVPMKGQLHGPVMSNRIAMCVLVGSLFLIPAFCTASASDQLVREAREATEAADPHMGDWQGDFESSQGNKSPLSAQVIALGKGRYQMNLSPSLYKGTTPQAVLKGQAKSKLVSFQYRNIWLVELP